MPNSTIIPRWQAARARRRLEDRRVLLLSGARQCGKTTLARALRTKDMDYRTLDDPNMLVAAQNDPLSFVRHARRTLMIDEIQRAPELLPAIKLVVDEDTRPGQFLLTGSANLAAIPQAQESLAGRVAKIRLRPFSQGERLGAEPTFLGQAFSGDYSADLQSTGRDEIIELALTGGYPEAVTLEGSARREWHRDYISALLERDLADIARIHRLDAMRQLVEVVAAWSSKLMTISEIAAGLSIKRPTVETYLSALEALFLIDRVPAWTKTDYSRVGKQDKLFMSDSGLMAAILNWRQDHINFDADRTGKLVETFVYNELAAHADLNEDYHIYHYRDRQGHEIDFLIEDDANGSLLGVEVKASATAKSEDFKHLRWFADNLAAGRQFRGIVVYSGNAVLSFGENMTAVPIAKLWSN